MCTKFTALEVGKGDAFLLQNQGWNCLFDAGQYSNIISLLKDKGIHRLHLAICSHNDVDHAKGFIELLKDGSIAIDEIWLPGTWASVLKYVQDIGFGPEEVEFLKRVEYEYNKKITDDPIFRINEDGTFAENNNKIYLLDPESEETIKNFEDRLHRSGFFEMIGSKFYEYYEDLRWWFPRLYLDFYSEHEKEAKYPSLVLAIDRIIKIAGIAYNKRCKIRWFNPVNYCTRYRVNYGFVALNSHEMFCLQKPKDAYCFAQLCLLTVVNEYSLVFEYWNDRLPIVRFSADSDCICQGALYNNHIIVTAPHHGSDDNRKVYNAINNNNVIWVRSDCKTKKRPCALFRSLKNKYCLACILFAFRKEIFFEYDKVSKQWNHKSGNSCKC